MTPPPYSHSRSKTNKILLWLVKTGVTLSPLVAGGLVAYGRLQERVRDTEKDVAVLTQKLDEIEKINRDTNTRVSRMEGRLEQFFSEWASSRSRK